MELTLKYDPKIRRSIAAAFIKGSDAGTWLQELNSWDITPEELTCLVVSQKKDTIEPAGLFVIFSEGKIPDASLLRHPYGVMAGKLFIPVNTSLWPEITTQELNALLVWDWQLFHPVIGFAGFEKTDRLTLTDLLDYPSALERDWTYAHPGLAPVPKLRQISITQPEQDILSILKENISSKPLAEIGKKKGEKRTWLMRLAEGAALTLLSVLLPLISAFKKMLPVRQEHHGRNTKPGWLNRLENWLAINIEELERKRSSEIQRLLKMFDEDMHEALQYAIPLNSNYETRGVAPPSSRLTRRDTSFNFSRLRGGGPVDSWDIGHHYTDLLTKYQRAAEKEIAARNFGKAAYIYAHLLGNFQAAANTLEQGQQYREAAAIYKDHLNNIPAAAACLEKGGLLLEAIELYKQLQMNEKAGDLYSRLEQQEQAAVHYELSVKQCLESNDHLGAARIMDEKLQETDRSRLTLLEGWHDGHQPEACLNRYFDIIAAREDQDLSLHILDIFNHKTPPSRSNNFLNVLAAVHRKNEQPEVKTLTTGIAYQLVSKQIALGNHRSVDMLTQFVSGDRLLRDDCSRFINIRRPTPRKAAFAASYQLAGDVKWQTAAVYGSYVLILGIKENAVYIVRANEDGKHEYFMWPKRTFINTSFIVASDAVYSNQVFVYAGAAALEEKLMPENDNFSGEAILTTPSWVPKRLLGYTVNKQGGLNTLHLEQNTPWLNFYNADGKLVSSVECTTMGNKIQLDGHQEPVRELICRNDLHYFSYDKFMLLVKSNGDTVTTSLESRILMLSASPRNTALRIIAATENGCLLLRYSMQQMQVVAGPFGEGITPSALRFLPDDLVVIAAGTKAMVFSIEDDTPVEVCTLETDTEIAAILPVPKRNYCVLLEKNGRISAHHIQQT